MISVKICGLCRPSDAAAAERAGADYLGVILSPGTRRSQTRSAAADIFSAASRARRVGVFVDAAPAEVRSAIAELALDVVQLHGQESSETAAALSAHAAVWKAVPVREPADLARAVTEYRNASALLFDAYHPALKGGSGTRLNWAELVEARRALPESLCVVLAGGLTPHNVTEAIRLLAPQIVDVSSGVEQNLGEKSVSLMQAFVSAARQASLVASK